MGNPSTLSCTDEMADPYAFTEIHWYPSWFNDAKKFATWLQVLKLDPNSVHYNTDSIARRASPVSLQPPWFENQIGSLAWKPWLLDVSLRCFIWTAEGLLAVTLWLIGWVRGVAHPLTLLKGAPRSHLPCWIYWNHACPLCSCFCQDPGYHVPQGIGKPFNECSIMKEEIGYLCIWIWPPTEVARAMIGLPGCK